VVMIVKGVLWWRGCCMVIFSISKNYSNRLQEILQLDTSTIQLTSFQPCYRTCTPTRKFRGHVNHLASLYPILYEQTIPKIWLLYSYNYNSICKRLVLLLNLNVRPFRDMALLCTYFVRIMTMFM